MLIRDKKHVEKVLSKTPVYVELGCGGVLHAPLENTIGIDISPNTIAHIIGDCAFEKLPLPDNSVDKVLAYDFLEHVPFAIWIKEDEKIKRLLPMIDLFNEVYRVLKHNGEFEIYVPFADSGQFNREIFQDPTHVSFWTPETFHYFSGDYFGFHDVYGHTSRFKKVFVQKDNINHIKAILRADKVSIGPYVI